jgi:hypothetical protein
VIQQKVSDMKRILIVGAGFAGMRLSYEKICNICGAGALRRSCHDEKCDGRDQDCACEK